MKTPLLLLLLAITVIIIILLKRIKTPETFPYRKKSSILTQTEQHFYNTLQKCLPDDHIILSKVRLADIFYISTSQKYKFHLYKILPKHIDFLICDKQNFTPLFAIELDDLSHLDKKETDNFKDNVFLSAKLPLLRIKASYNYNPEKIKEKIKPFTIERKEPYENNIWKM